MFQDPGVLCDRATGGGCAIMSKASPGGTVGLPKGGWISLASALRSLRGMARLTHVRCHLFKQKAHVPMRFHILNNAIAAACCSQTWPPSARQGNEPCATIDFHVCVITHIYSKQRRGRSDWTFWPTVILPLGWKLCTHCNLWHVSCCRMLLLALRQPTSPFTPGKAGGGSDTTT